METYTLGWWNAVIQTTFGIFTSFNTISNSVLYVNFLSVWFIFNFSNTDKINLHLEQEDVVLCVNDIMLSQSLLQTEVEIQLVWIRSEGTFYCYKLKLKCNEFSLL